MASVAALTDTTIVGQNEEQLVTMIVDKQLFGIPILQVQDIVEASKITPVPLAPSAIAGVLNLRGRIVTVIDLRKLLGNTEEVPWDSQMGVTVEYKGDLYTLLVDAIGDVRTLPKRDFDGAPSTLEDKVRKLCSGIFRLRGNLLVVLDVSRILLPEIIEATPMLSVEDRRARKDAAQAASDETRTEKGRQLSTLMTDLNAYESDHDSGLDSLSGDSDDIKARKKANRDRRPVGERWKEVLEEKARREGSTVYRMREPDEEVLEGARDDAEKQQAAWEAELQARQSDSYESRLSEPEEQAGDLTDYDQPAPASESAPADLDMTDMASDEPVAADLDMADMASDEPVAADLDMADMASDEPVAAELDMTDMASDEPVAADLDMTDPVSDEPVAADLAMADPVSDDFDSTDLTATDPVADDMASLEDPAPADLTATDPVVDDLASLEDPAPADLTATDPVADDLASLDDLAPADLTATDPVADDLASLDDLAPADLTATDPVADDLASLDDPAPADLTATDPEDLDEPSAPESMEGGTETPAGTSSVISDWWGKMRRKPGDDAKKAEPATDETPAESDESAAEDASGDKGKKPKKKASSSKSKAKKKK